LESHTETRSCPINEKKRVCKTSRQLEISSATLYKWERHFDEHGEKGLILKPISDKKPELEKLKKENHELKMSMVEEELIIRIQNELLKKALSKTSDYQFNLGITKSLGLKICEISRSSFCYKPKFEALKVGRSLSTTTTPTTGGYDNNELVVEHIKTLLAEPFVDYGYLKVTFSLRDEKNYFINPKKVYRLMKANNLLCAEKGSREFSKRQ
jgi:putative transposase